MKINPLMVAAVILVICGLSHSVLENFHGHRRFRGNRRRFSRNHGWYRNPLFMMDSWPHWTSYMPLPCNCKRGCTMNGCAVPGSGPNDCVWASDCNCC